jgi:hypothetical protein
MLKLAWLPAAFVRDGFSALALDSYPEAYAEFNQLMLAFVYPEVALTSELSSLTPPR